MFQEIKDTNDFLNKAYGKDLTNEQASEGKARLVKLFSLLIEIDRKNKAKNVSGK